MRISSLLVCLAVLSADGAFAGTRIAAETRRLDREGSAEQVTLHIDGERLRFDGGDGRSSIIYRGDRPLVWIVDHRDKKYMEVNRGTTAALDKANSMIRDGMKGLPPERRAALESLLGGAQAQVAAGPKITVRPTGERDLVGGRTCDEQEVLRGQERVALVCTASLASLGMPADSLSAVPGLVAFAREAFESLAAIAPGVVDRQAIDALGSLANVEGLPVRARVFDKGKPVAETVVTEVAQEASEGSRFEVPDGYRGGFSLGNLDLGS